MKTFSFVLAVILFVSCSQNTQIENKSEANLNKGSLNQASSPKEEKNPESLPSPSEQIKMPDVKDFGVFDVFRKSNQKDEAGRMIQPFYEAEIGIRLDNEPKVGEKVTVIPLNVNLEPFQLSITKTEKKEKACTEAKKEYYWDTEIEKLTNKEILEIAPLKDRVGEFPFDAAVIYPSVNFAKKLQRI